MIQIVLATIGLALILNRETESPVAPAASPPAQPTTEAQVTPVAYQVKDIPVIKPMKAPVMQQKPLPKNNMGEKPTLDSYQNMTSHAVFDPGPSHQQRLAQLFLDKYLKQSHINCTQEQTDLPKGVYPHDHDYVQTYRCLYDSRKGNGEQLWQVTAIATIDGNIYLSLLLDRDGVIPSDTQGIQITYDNPNIGYDVSYQIDPQIQRFGKIVFHNSKFVDSEEVLRYLLGDDKHPHSVNYYLRGDDST